VHQGGGLDEVEGVVGEQEVSEERLQEEEDLEVDLLVVRRGRLAEVKAPPGR
jgi:hypothetical protein